MTRNIGRWAFLLGVIISLLAAFLTNIVATSIIVLTLFILGLLVGFLNVSRKDYLTFLVAVLVLLVLGVGGIGALSEVRLLGIYDYLSTALGSFTAFVGAAGLIVAIRAVLDTNPGLGLVGIKKK
jgi:hypothetical protein